MRTAALLVALTLAQTALADGLDPVEAAKIEQEQKAAEAKVNKAHGDKQESEMSAEERRQVAAEQSKADLEVLEKHGVSDKEYSRYVAKETPEQRQQHKAATKELERQAEEAKKNAAAPKPDQPKAADQVQITRGDGNGVEIPVKGHENDVVIERGNQDEAGQVPVEVAPPQRSRSRSKHHSSKSKHHHRR